MTARSPNTGSANPDGVGELRFKVSFPGGSLGSFREVSGIGVEVVRDPDELAAAARRATGEVVVQTLARGAEHTIDVLVDRRGRAVCAVPRRRIEVRAGEVLGIAGVDGNGQMELAEAILGLRPVRSGAIELPGSRRPRSETGYIPQDRRRAGLVLPMSVRDNLILELQQEPEAGRGPWLRWS